ncbi:hypothetical protein [Bradyrhizobium sp. CCGB01]|uniref:hypothetical protein n=1 Tax=Bradyrhizobium sp. CCGB01 TaxID=2949634 RepID=UPI0020B422AB|nr:hypothetical protein [Bradyrhizobium sp. CCGB01]MCP3405560.1 hypothetical protein [Bradyrhizobium sp. CCGB01]
MADNTAAEVHRAFRIPVAGAPANHCLLRPSYADEKAAIALGIDSVTPDLSKEQIVRSDGRDLIEEDLPQRSTLAAASAERPRKA